MLAWLGILGQAVSTKAGAVSNATAHIGDVYHCNVLDRSGCGFLKKSRFSWRHSNNNNKDNNNSIH